MPKGPLIVYRARVDDGALKPDPAQELLAEKLQSLHQALAYYTPVAAGIGWKERFGWVRRRENAPLGLYIYGGVGGGKSMLMDLFYENVAVERKRRAHFHEFLQDVHGRLSKFRAEKSDDQGDPIPAIADQIASEAWLICFDELQVFNIVDAMILGRLFEGLFQRGVVMVATSNRPPQDLYKDGLQRQNFLPFIDLISEKLELLQLASGADYRLQRMKNMRAYHQPADDKADIALTVYFEELTGGHTPLAEKLVVQGRIHQVPAACGVARMAFADLCQNPLGAADYLELAERFHTLILDGIPEMDEAEAAAARRFVTLIDALYENKVKLICSADVPPERLYINGEGAFEFKRLVSRLMEMQSLDYLALAHGRVK